MSLRIFHELLDELNNGQKTALAILVRKSGSAPRDVGASIVVTGDGRLLGSLGGGCMEAEVHETARQALANQSFCLRKFSLSHDLAAAEGLVCGGTIWVAVIPLGEEHRAFFRQLIEAAGRSTAPRFCLAFNAQQQSPEPGSPAYSMFIYETETSAISALSGPAISPGTSLLNPHEIEGATPALSMNDGRWLYHELLVTIPDLIIFGGGHISLNLVRMASSLGFRITVVDDRPIFANPQRFPEADIVILNEFETAWEKLEPRPSPYIIIVTRGHQHDDTVLREALRHKHEYIGMIGSKHKVRQIIDQLRVEGTPEKALRRLYAPIGLDLGSETPAEIAVSILSEICAIRHLGHDPKRVYGHMRAVKA